MTYARIHPFDLFALLEKLTIVDFWKTPTKDPSVVRIHNTLYFEDRSMPVCSEGGKKLLRELS